MAIDDETDLAVLKIDEKGLPPLPLADSDTVRPGQIVLAFGSPLGLDSSVTMGVVSAVARQLEQDDPMIYIQTDASINPGNSGGPLVDADGRVVGINTLILTQSGGNEGLGFAAPSNIVRNVFEQVRDYGRVRRGEIGVRAQTITPALAEGLRLSRDWGVVLGDVYPDGPAAKAGLEVGDIVTRRSTASRWRTAGSSRSTCTAGRSARPSRWRSSAGRKTMHVLRSTVVERDDDPMRFAALASADDLGRAAARDRRARHHRSRSGAAVGPAGADRGRRRLGLARRPAELGRRARGRRRDPRGEPGRDRLARGPPPGAGGVKAGQSIVLQVEREGTLRYVAGRIE